MNEINIKLKVTQEDIKKSIVDEFGAKYSEDGTRLLEGPRRTDGFRESIYNIKDGTRCICSEAFSKASYTVVIPESVELIADDFVNYKFVSVVVHPNNQYYEVHDSCLFTKGLRRLMSFGQNIKYSTFKLPEETEQINSFAFQKYRFNLLLTRSDIKFGPGKEHLFHNGLHPDTEITIPAGSVSHYKQELDCVWELISNNFKIN